MHTKYVAAGLTVAIAATTDMRTKNVFQSGENNYCTFVRIRAVLRATGLLRTPPVLCKPDEPRLTLSRTTRVKAHLNSPQLTPDKGANMCFSAHNNDHSDLRGTL